MKDSNIKELNDLPESEIIVGDVPDKDLLGTPLCETTKTLSLEELGYLFEVVV
jgi:hypothetical protein